MGFSRDHTRASQKRAPENEIGSNASRKSKSRSLVPLYAPIERAKSTIPVEYRTLSGSFWANVRVRACQCVHAIQNSSSSISSSNNSSDNSSSNQQQRQALRGT
jgi:hypothetical protein